MRRRDFIKSIGGVAAGWRARTLMGAAVLQSSAQLVPQSPAAAQSAANLQIEIVPRIGHSAGVNCVAFAPGGRTIASGSDDKTLKLWDVASGREMRTLIGHTDRVTAMAWSTDRQRIVSGSVDQTVRIWDATSGRVLRTLVGHRDWITAVVFSPTGHVVASVGAVTYGNGVIKLWNVATGRELRTLTTGHDWAWVIKFSADGRTITAGVGSVLRSWNVASGRELAARAGFYNQVRDFSPTDPYLVISDDYFKTLRVHGKSVRQTHTLQGHDLKVSAVSLSPNRRVLATGSVDTTLRLWDTATGNQLFVLEGHTSWVNAVTFSPDARTIVSGSKDKTLKFWDVASGRELHTFSGRSVDVSAVAFSPDGQAIACGSNDKTVKVWDAGSGRLVRTFVGHQGAIKCVSFAPDSLVIVSGSSDKTVRLWDLAAGREGRILIGHTGEIAAVAFSPDGRTIVSGGPETKLWDASTGQELRTDERTGVHAIAFTPDGQSVASAHSDGTVKVWDLKTGHERRVLRGHENGVTAVAVSSDGRTIATGGGLSFVEEEDADNTVRLFDGASGRQLRVLSGHGGGRGNWVSSIAFAPDGVILVTGGRDNTVKIWDVASGRELRTLRGHYDDVTGVAFSPDGRTVVSGSLDGTIRRWRTMSGELLVTSITGSTGEWLTITAEGFFNSSDNGAQLLGAVRGFDVFAIDQFYQQLYRPDVVRQKLSFDTERVKYAASKVSLEKIMASKAPPEITIVSPQEKSETNQHSVKVEAKLAHRDADNNGGIGRVEWRVNGVTRAVEDFQHPANAGQKIIARQLALPPGDSVIALVAYNKANLAASLPVAVSVTVKSSAPRPQPTLHLLAVGVDKYPKSQIGDLNYAVADAKAVLAAFELFKSDKTDYADVIGHSLFNEQATKRTVQAEFKRLSKIIRPDDVFVLYLAGHGVTLDGRFYFLSHDAKGTFDDLKVESAIGQNQVQDWLSEIPAFRSVLIYDSCESGSATEDRSGFRGLQQLVAAEKLSRSIGRTVLSATTDVTAAMEGYEKHGIFTYVLLDAFAYADRDNDGKITTEELAEYLRAKLPQLTDDLAKKHPELKLSRQEPQVKLFGASFALVPRADIADIHRVRQ